MAPRRFSDEEGRAALAASLSLHAAAVMLGVSRQAITRFAQTMHIDLSHMRPGRNRPSTDIFALHARPRRGAVRKAYALSGVPYLCSICGLGPMWNEQPLVLELDHINGESCDIRYENLRWLCPNCHSQEPTSKGRNHKNKGPRKSRRNDNLLH